jgi:hypothetical protein
MYGRNALSTLTVTTIGLACKAFLNLGFCSSVSVKGLHNLLDALSDEERKQGKGVVTGKSPIYTVSEAPELIVAVSNHISVLVFASPISTKLLTFS